MIRTITLTPSSSSIIGKYRSGEVVAVLCDASTGAFTVSLPDANIAHDVFFCFKKIDITGNVITISTTVNQTIDDSSQIVLSRCNDSIIIIPGSGEYMIFAESNQGVDVRFFGASESSNTNETAIQAALEYCDKIIIDGDYRISSAITISNDNVMISGSGKLTMYNAALPDNNKKKNMLIISGENALIEGITIDAGGTGTYGSPSWSKGVVKVLQGANNLTIKNVTFQNLSDLRTTAASNDNYYLWMYADGVLNYTVESCVFKDLSVPCDAAVGGADFGGGIMHESSNVPDGTVMTYGRVMNCLFEDFVSRGQADSGYSDVEGIRWYYSTQNASYGDGTATLTFQQTLVSNCVFRNMPKSAIKSEFGDVHVCDCLVDTNATSAMPLFAAVRMRGVNSNLVSNLKIKGNFYYVVEVEGHCDIDGLYIDNNSEVNFVIYISNPGLRAVQRNVFKNFTIPTCKRLLSCQYSQSSSASLVIDQLVFENITVHGVTSGATSTHPFINVFAVRDFVLNNVRVFNPDAIGERMVRVTNVKNVYIDSCRFETPLIGFYNGNGNATNFETLEIKNTTFDKVGATTQTDSFIIQESAYCKTRIENCVFRWDRRSAVSATEGPHIIDDAGARAIVRGCTIEVYSGDGATAAANLPLAGYFTFEGSGNKTFIDGVIAISDGLTLGSENVPNTHVINISNGSYCFVRNVVTEIANGISLNTCDNTYVNGILVPNGLTEVTEVSTTDSLLGTDINDRVS